MAQQTLDSSVGSPDTLPAMTIKINANFAELYARIWSGTQAEYDAIVTKDAAVVYLITAA